MTRTFDDWQNASASCRFIRHRTLVAIALSLVLVTPGMATTLSARPLPVAAASSEATPALWEVHDGDTTIYLFGTFHTLDDRTTWFDRSIRAAFDQSGEVVLETIVPQDPAQIHAIGRAITGPHPAPTDFLAQTRSAVNRGRAEGLTVALGADAVLRGIAVEEGKTLAGIELFADQLRTLARIPAPAPAPHALPHAAPVTVNDLLVAWKAGDTRAFSVMLAGFEARSPAAYQLLIADRNARFGAWIAHRLDQPGIVFVAVGSGHLAGKDSVQHWLFAKGIAARRIA